MDTMLPLELLQILACPDCKGELTQNQDGSSLRCTPCGREYPVVDGIPVLLPLPSGAAPRSKGEAQ